MAFFTNTRLQSLFFLLLAFLLYANTLGHGFVLDDQVTIVQNSWVQEGLKGLPKIFSQDAFSGFLHAEDAELLLSGGRYRPLPMAFFAVLAQFFGNNALVFHLFSVLLYALCCLVLYRTLLRAFQPAIADGDQSPALLAWGASLLFAVHPVHVEVVANVKSCDEQLALLLGLLAIGALFRAFDSGRRSGYWLAGLLLLLACLAKETALALLLVGPVALWVFRDWSPLRLKTLANGVLPLLVAVGAYVALRGMALNWQFAGSSMNDPLNNPFLKMGTTEWEPYSAGDKIATIGFILLKYLRLLVWPHPLTHDYYPFTIARQTLSAPLALTGLGVYAGLLLWAVWGLMKKWRLAFGLLLFLLPLLLVSNLLFPVGTFMAERFLFMPSAGFSLVFAAVLFGAFRRVRLPNWAPLGAAGLAAVALAALTLLRNPAWKSNQSLMEADLKASANSAKLNHSYGTLMLDQALVAVDTARRSQLLRKSEEHLRKALSLHASYYDAALAYGACAFYLGDFDRSVMAYQGAYRVNPADPKSKTGLLYALRYGGQYFAGPGQDSARAVVYFTQAWDIQPDTALAAGLARHFSRYNQPQEAIAWLERGLALAPGDPGLTRALGAAYRSAGMPEKAANLGKQPSSFLIVPPSGGK